MNSLSSMNLATKTAGLLGLLAAGVAIALPVAAQMKPQVEAPSSSKPAETTVPTTPNVSGTTTSGSTTSGSTTSGSTTPALPTIPRAQTPSTGSGVSGSGISGSGMTGSGSSSGMSGSGVSGSGMSGSSSGMSGSGMTGSGSSSGVSGSGSSSGMSGSRMTPPNSPVSSPNVQTPTQPTLPNTQTPGSRTSPSSQAPSTQRSGATSTTASRTIVDVASASDSFKTLVAALNEAELAEVLKGQGPFTVFAPTDAAFAALPPGTVDQLLKPENRATLIKILKYHVVAGDYPSDRLASGQVPTAEGSPVTVTVKDGKVKVNDANVVQPDIAASNGVIHAIDRVILPPQ